ncbi:MAG: plastocyanin/azurin family copper-binding protein [Vicinamibacterales bacterium]
MGYRLTGAAAALAAAVAWGCAGGGSSPAASPTAPSPAAPAQSAVTVSIVSSSGNRAFTPNPVAAKAGDSVRFVNNDALTHHIVMDDGSADLGVVAPGATSQAMTLQDAKATTFHCLLHSSMVGSINGDAPPEPPVCTDPTGYTC